jgi:hypothetical protein
MTKYLLAIDSDVYTFDSWDERNGFLAGYITALEGDERYSYRNFYAAHSVQEWEEHDTEGNTAQQREGDGL